VGLLGHYSLQACVGKTFALVWEIALVSLVVLLFVLVVWGGNPAVTNLG